MSYIVPGNLPKFCNKCPFGMCNYNNPFWASMSINMIDLQENPVGSYGYVCNLDFFQNGQYTKVLRAKTDHNIKKPKWCQLKEMKGDDSDE